MWWGFCRDGERFVDRRGFLGWCVGRSRTWNMAKNPVFPGFLYPHTLQNSHCCTSITKMSEKNSIKLQFYRVFKGFLSIKSFYFFHKIFFIEIWTAFQGCEKYVTWRKEIKIFLPNKILVSLKIFVQSPHAQTFHFLYNFKKMRTSPNYQNISKNLYILPFCQNILSISRW